MLTGENIKLRALELSDVDLFYKWENDTSTWKITGTNTPFSKFTLKKYLSSAYLDIYTNKQVRMMIELHSGIAIGNIELFDYEPFHRRVGLGIVIAEDSYRRLGFASEAMKILIDYCFTTLELHQIYCYVSIEN